MQAVSLGYGSIVATSDPSAIHSFLFGPAAIPAGSLSGCNAYSVLIVPDVVIFVTWLLPSHHEVYQRSPSELEDVISLG